MQDLVISDAVLRRARQEVWSAADYRRAIGEILREELEAVPARRARQSDGGAVAMRRRAAPTGPEVRE